MAKELTSIEKDGEERKKRENVLSNATYRNMKDEHKKTTLI